MLALHLPHPVPRGYRWHPSVDGTFAAYSWKGFSVASISKTKDGFWKAEKGDFKTCFHTPDEAAEQVMQWVHERSWRDQMEDERIERSRFFALVVARLLATVFAGVILAIFLLVV